MDAHQTKEAPALSFPEAVRSLLEEFSWNPWFLNSYWPENEPRIRLMARLALERFPSPRGHSALEVGCANGFVAYVFRMLGFDVSAVDAYESESRNRLFGKAGIHYQLTNLNEVVPLADFPSESFDVILLGEVFEHILNQPTGLLKSVFRLLKPDGQVLLTTPNPSTLANAIRVVRDKHLLWGTTDFLKETKLDPETGAIIDRGEIHYREYPAWLVRDLMKELGFRIDGIRYVRAGVAPTQPFAKRLIKRVLVASGLARLRILSPGYVIWARKPS